MYIPAYFLTVLSYISPYFTTKPAGQPLAGHVNLRIEGENATYFEGPVYTWIHYAHPESGGRYLCDGTNANRNSIPGPTVTGTMDGAAWEYGFKWNGTFYTSMDDPLVTEISGEAGTDTQYWGSVLNYATTNHGGCQVKVNEGDEVMWAKLNSTGTAQFLKLSGQTSAQVNQGFNVTVTDALNSPVAGAVIDGKTSDVNGNVLLNFATPGVQNLKAAKTNFVRSNKLTVTVQ